MSDTWVNWMGIIPSLWDCLLPLGDSDSFMPALMRYQELRVLHTTEQTASMVAGSE